MKEEEGVNNNYIEQGMNVGNSMRGVAEELVLNLIKSIPGVEVQEVFGELIIKIPKEIKSDKVNNLSKGM